MNDFLKERLLRQLSTLSDDKVYQVLDYAVFLGCAEGVEDTMRAGKMSASTVAQTMGFLSQAMGVLNGVAAAGKSVAGDLVNAAAGTTALAPSSPPVAPPAAAPTAPASEAAASPVEPKP